MPSDATAEASDFCLIKACRSAASRRCTPISAGKACAFAKRKLTALMRVPSPLCSYLMRTASSIQIHRITTASESHESDTDLSSFASEQNTEMIRFPADHTFVLQIEKAGFFSAHGIRSLLLISRCPAPARRKKTPVLPVIKRCRAYKSCKRALAFPVARLQKKCYICLCYHMQRGAYRRGISHHRSNLRTERHLQESALSL